MPGGDNSDSICDEIASPRDELVRPLQPEKSWLVSHEPRHLNPATASSAVTVVGIDSRNVAVMSR